MLVDGPPGGGCRRGSHARVGRGPRSAETGLRLHLRLPARERGGQRRRPGARPGRRPLQHGGRPRGRLGHREPRPPGHRRRLPRPRAPPGGRRADARAGHRRHPVSTCPTSTRCVAALDAVDEPWAPCMLLDVLEHLLQPQQLLVALSAVGPGARPADSSWSRCPTCAHFDVAFACSAAGGSRGDRPARRHPHPVLHRGDAGQPARRGRVGDRRPARTSSHPVRTSTTASSTTPCPPRWWGAARPVRRPRTPTPRCSSTSGPSAPFPSSTRRPPTSTPSGSPRSRRRPARAPTCGPWPTTWPPSGILASEAARRAVLSSYGHRGSVTGEPRDTVADLKKQAVRRVDSEPEVGTGLPRSTTGCADRARDDHARRTLGAGRRLPTAAAPPRSPAPWSHWASRASTRPTA